MHQDAVRRRLRPGTTTAGSRSATGDAGRGTAVALSGLAFARPQAGATIRRYTVAELRERHESQIADANVPGGGSAGPAAPGRSRVAGLRANFEAPQPAASHAPAPSGTTHRAWTTLALGNSYAMEQQLQSAHLLDAVRGLADVIRDFWNARQALSALPANAPEAALSQVTNLLPTSARAVAAGKNRDALRKYLDTVYQRQYAKARLQQLPVSEQGVLGDLTTRLVAYDTSPQAQRATKILFGGGKLYRNDDAHTPVDTADSVTHFSGKGIEIFVVSPNGELHMTSHRIGLRHHSSLLAGQDVAMGGEIKVNNGTIEWITNKSGHYQPSKTHLVQFLHFLEKDGVDLGTIEIRAGFGVPGGHTAREIVDGIGEDVLGDERADARQGWAYLKTSAAYQSLAEDMKAQLRASNMPARQLRKQIRAVDREMTTNIDTAMRELIESFGYAGSGRKGTVRNTATGNLENLDTVLKRIRRDFKQDRHTHQKVRKVRSGQVEAWQ